MATDHEGQHKPIDVVRDVLDAPWVRKVVRSLLFCVSIGAGACGSDGPGPSPIPHAPPPPNNAPVIRSIEAGQPRLEVGASTTFTAVVDDVETAPERLQYQWTAEAGTFSGAGARVSWQAPATIAEPVNPVITLAVIETYTLNGVQQTNRTVLTSVAVRVHDSRAELAGLVDSFLDDFEDSSVPASSCVRNFSSASDRCSKGRRSELDDIEFNRRNYIMLPASRHSNVSVTITEPWARAEMRYLVYVRLDDQGDRADGHRLGHLQADGRLRAGPVVALREHLHRLHHELPVHHPLIIYCGLGELAQERIASRNRGAAGSLCRRPRRRCPEGCRARRAGGVCRRSGPVAAARSHALLGALGLQVRARPAGARARAPLAQWRRLHSRARAGRRSEQPG